MIGKTPNNPLQRTRRKRRAAERERYAVAAASVMASERFKPVLRTLLSSIGLGFLISGCHSKPDYSSILSQLQQHGFFAHFTDAEGRALGSGRR